MTHRKPRIVATVEARMTSSRLPGKVLMPILGKPTLFYLIERLRSVSTIDEIVLATTQNQADNILEAFATENSVSCFRGSEEDVMDRVLRAGEESDADIIVEITGDCPLLDVDITDQVINTYLSNSADYVSNCHVRSYPDGMDVQVFGIDSLRASAAMTQQALDREHVSLHMRNNPDIFPQINLIAPRKLRRPELALTLDEMADFLVIKGVLENLYPISRFFNCEEIIDFLDKNPHLVEINQNVSRKGNT